MNADLASSRVSREPNVRTSSEAERWVRCIVGAGCPPHPYPNPTCAFQRIGLSSETLGITSFPDVVPSASSIASADRITRTSAYAEALHLSPFALYSAINGLDYYGDSVALPDAKGFEFRQSLVNDTGTWSGFRPPFRHLIALTERRNDVGTLGGQNRDTRLIIVRCA